MKDKENNKNKEQTKITDKTIKKLDTKEEIKENYEIGIEYYKDIEKHQS